ncbi:hypothetical protein [Thalassovita taeanensis]|uniref:TRAP-type C4-dicarboxylate transport system, substrate-binding protein n=1 Tax=Thalassovita taeanensis TaxID=657014 RepID=A0A1H9HCN1_9RHOB|nr:hypothetical protein [Thalassovita taeanensis]SEQ60109.1 TRAP-type C4-dicarboxylate transport system, substrate-binding protein [Thalassovita taeanensis]
MKHLTKSACAAAVIAFGITPTSTLAEDTLKLTFAAGHPEIFLWEKHVRETFIPVLTEELAKTGELSIEWTQAYAGTLVKVGSEVESFQQGIMDVGHMSGVFNPAQLGLMNVSYAMPFGPEDPKLVTEAVETALWENPDILSQMENAAGIKYIGAGFAIDGYNIPAIKPIETLADLDGMKIGGAGPNLNWLRSTGAVGVQGSYVSFYNDIKTGVYDGHIGWLTAHVPAKVYEVAPYWNNVRFGAMYVGGLGIRLGLWETFSDETKQAFLTAAAAYTEAYFAEQAVRYTGAEKALAENGGTVVEMVPSDRAAWIAQMPNPTAEWKAAAEARGEAATTFVTAYRDHLAKNGFTYERDYLAE